MNQVCVLYNVIYSLKGVIYGTIKMKGGIVYDVDDIVQLILKKKN